MSKNFFCLISLHNFFSKLFKSVVADKTEEFLSLEVYVEKRKDVDFADVFPESSSNWTLSNRENPTIMNSLDS